VADRRPTRGGDEEGPRPAAGTRASSGTSSGTGGRTGSLSAGIMVATRNRRPVQIGALALLAVVLLVLVFSAPSI